MLLAEWMARSHRHYEVQHFATDIDSRAVSTARAGLYPASIAADVSPGRHSRFFTPEADGQAYRIKKRVRDQLIFSEQDLIRDPPFSRLDLLSCRNVLICVDAELQKRLIPHFHYALRPDGVLFLGTSEGVGSFESHFEPVDRKAKIFRRRADSPSGRLVLPGRTFPAAPPSGAAPPHATTPLVTQKKPSLRQLTEHALLQQVVSAGMLVDAEGDMLYLHGRSGMFLEPTPGEARVSNILRMAREGLHRELGATLRKAATSPGSDTHIADLIPPLLREEAITRMQRLASAGTLESYRTQRVTKGGTVRDVSIITTQLVDETGESYAIATTERSRRRWEAPCRTRQDRGITSRPSARARSCDGCSSSSTRRDCATSNSTSVRRVLYEA